MLNKVCVGNIDDEVENLLKSRFTQKSDENYPKDALHMYAENEPAMKRNEGVLNELPGKLYTIEPDNCSYPLVLIQAAQNQKQINKGSLANVLKLNIGAKIMLTVNIDIQDRLINGQTGIVRHIDFAQGSACKVYIKVSDKQAGSKAMRSSYLGRQNSGVC